MAVSVAVTGVGGDSGESFDLKTNTHICKRTLRNFFSFGAFCIFLCLFGAQITGIRKCANTQMAIPTLFVC